ncbi:MAG: hypothetical protein FWD87_02580 [Spirochaetaceae bacterium]|nr:hypothetical protein [Spirochaetaceae bacterium]
MSLNIVSKIDKKVKISNVIISVFDKTNLDHFIKKLIQINPDITIYSTGGTYKYLTGIEGIKEGKNLVSISDYTKQPEMQGGLVKTLDFRIYMGILSEKYNAEHKKDLERTSSIEFDMLVVNLYPFSSVIKKQGLTPEEARTNIDIGGPCMLRASAKNFHRVASVCSPAEYDTIIKEMEENKGQLSLETRFKLACTTFEHTASYDTTIAKYLASINIADFEKLYNID